MILFTGHGAIASAFLSQFKGEVISLRQVGETDLIRWIKTADVIIHNASNIKPVNLSEAFEHNVFPTKRLVDALIKVGFKGRFIFISSMSLLDARESYKPSSDLSPYALSKFICEQYILNSGLTNIALVRFSTIYYGQPEKDGLSSIVDSALKRNQITLFNNGSAKRDFIPLDIAVLYLNKVASFTGERKIFNLCSGRECTFLELAKSIQGVLPNTSIQFDNTTIFNDFVLSHFDSSTINELGVIQFDIIDKIKDQIQKK